MSPTTGLASRSVETTALEQITIKSRTKSGSRKRKGRVRRTDNFGKARREAYAGHPIACERACAEAQTVIA